MFSASKLVYKLISFRLLDNPIFGKFWWTHDRLCIYIIRTFISDVKLEAKSPLWEVEQLIED